MNFRSVLAGGSHRGGNLTDEWYPRLQDAFPVKFWWFHKHGYEPHIWQMAFHGAFRPEDDVATLTRFRHLVAGRRGGKTLSAAWEVLFYALHPREFHRDAHGTDNDRPLWIWVLTKDYPTGFPALTTLLDVMRQAGLVKGRDYQHNKTERRIEFTASGTVLQFKTADDPQSLRGAGLDILWMDEAAFIDSPEAWRVVRPALSDKLGLVITTTTPHGKNWLWEEFFDGPALDDRNQFRVEYTSLDNPYFPREEWEYAREFYHPIFFRQEFLAAFDAMVGLALHGDWLKFWVAGNPDVQSGDITVKHLLTEDGRYRMRTFIGIDPAISLSDDADHFAMAVIGITDDNMQAFLLDYFVGRISFPEQIERIKEWQLKWRPQYIGVESNAFQRAIVQQVTRGFDAVAGVIPVISKGKKEERILTMSPLFKIGKIRIHRRHGEFIEQWVNFDPERKNQDDDLLDAVEIALGVAGVLLPEMPHATHIDQPRPESANDVARAQLRAMKSGRDRPYDPVLGAEA